MHGWILFNMLFYNKLMQIWDEDAYGVRLFPGSERYSHSLCGGLKG